MVVELGVGRFSTSSVGAVGFGISSGLVSPRCQPLLPSPSESMLIKTGPNNRCRTRRIELTHRKSLFRYFLIESHR
jgi:hypothetical protein